MAMFFPKWGGGATSGGGGGGGAPAGGGGGGGGQSYASVARNGGETVEEKKQRADNQKKLFQVKLELEGNRKSLGKGNMFTVLKDRVGDFEPELITQNEIGKLLILSKIPNDKVLGVKQNEFRKGQVEVLLSDDVKIDIDEMKKVINDEEMRMSVGVFDQMDEVFMVYGLPLTTDIEGMRDNIKEAIEPFVRKIVSIEPSKYFDSKTSEFLKGKYNGNWHVVVEPKREIGVPNFIVVDQTAKVMGQVVYKKKHFYRPEMCSDCYREGHYKRSKDCKGIRFWNDYTDEFFQMSSKERQKMGGDQPSSRPRNLTKVDTLNDALREEKKKNEDLEKKISKVEEEKADKIREVSQSYVEQLEGKERDYTETFNKLVKEKEEVVAKMDEVIAELALAKSKDNNEIDRNDLLSSIEGLEEELSVAMGGLGTEFEGSSVTSSKDDVPSVEDLVVTSDLKDSLPADRGKPDTNLGVKVDGGEPIGTSNNGKTGTFDINDKANNIVNSVESKDEQINIVKVIKTVDSINQETVDLKDDDKTENNKRKKDNSPLNNDDKKARRYPTKGMVIWVFEKGEKVKYVVGSKKDALENGGSFNCTDANSKKKVSVNFNKLDWEEYKEEESIKVVVPSGPPPLPPRPVSRSNKDPAVSPPVLSPLLTKLDDKKVNKGEKAKSQL